ncbi:hypothetical protein K6U06_21095 [Acidiferrimicrobium sp. IK]|uniref:hypothetical protein n=1 Tax=Acidiferrimicrobium sp. IK TaxID=2871700 RepID=UPI0021CAECF7|nr:hypothetical protein [Acidiferrimicrobium sp. IK]MCU4186876.1 hypothetical protein [Acidiferrimicrobium sp. IK]
MARVNITMPDELVIQARNARLNLSQVAQRAVAAELDRLSKIAELDTYLAELDAELGPVTEEDRAEARTWADQALGLPCVVLTGALTGDHRRDYPENRLLRACDVRPVDELVARAAAVLRSQVTGRRIPSGVDAIVVAVADGAGGATILTGDPGDLSALARHAKHEVTVSRV